MPGCERRLPWTERGCRRRGNSLPGGTWVAWQGFCPWCCRNAFSTGLPVDAGPGVAQSSGGAGCGHVGGPIADVGAGLVALRRVLLCLLAIVVGDLVQAFARWGFGMAWHGAFLDGECW